MRPIPERYANVRFWWENPDSPPLPLFYQSGWGLAQIPWKCLQTGLRCGESLVSANPLIFNGICFDIAFPIRNNFISLFLRVSLFFCRLKYIMGSFSGYPLWEDLVVLKGPYFCVCFSNSSSSFPANPSG